MEDEAVTTLVCDCCGLENRRPLTERETELIKQGRRQQRDELLVSLGKIIQNPDLNLLTPRMSLQVLMAGLTSENREEDEGEDE